MNHPATGLCGKTVIGVRIPMDKDGKARGICFVDFNSKAAAEKGLKKDGQKMQGREVKVVLSAGQDRGSAKNVGPQPEGCRTLFVKNLDYKYEPKELRKALGKKHVKEVRPFLDRETGEQKGMAYVEFNDEAAAAEGMKHNGELFLQRPLKMDWTVLFILPLALCIYGLPAGSFAQI